MALINELSEEQKIAIFTKFLKENGVFGKYINEFSKSIWNEEKNFITFISETSLNAFLSYAFDWRNTENGSTFWRKIDSKWVKTLNELISK